HLQSKPQGDLGVVVDDTKAPKGVTVGAEEKDVSFETGEGEQVEFQSGPYILACIRRMIAARKLKTSPSTHRLLTAWGTSGPGNRALVSRVWAPRRLVCAAHARVWLSGRTLLNSPASSVSGMITHTKFSALVRVKPRRCAKAQPR